MYTAAIHVGRLLETVMREKVSRQDIDAVDQLIASLIRERSENFVVIADYRATRFLLEEDAEHLVKMLRSYNDRIERSAIMVSVKSAVGVLQMERVTRESHHPSRRSFRDPHEAAAWLDEVLSPAERARLRVALGI